MLNIPLVCGQGFSCVLTGLIGSGNGTTGEKITVSGNLLQACREIGNW